MSIVRPRRFRTWWLRGAALLAGCLIALPAPAQQDPKPDALTAKFQLADSYLRAGQFERAVGLLEDLYHTDPAAYVFFEKLKEAYVSLKRYDDAIALVDDQLRQGPTPVLLSEKAALIFQKGDEAAADAVWEEALALQPDHPQTYRVVYLSLAQHRLFERSIDALLRGREVLDDDGLFRNDLSYLYGVLGRHQQAMMEYVEILTQDPAQLTFVKRRLARFSEQDGMLDQSLVVVERAIRRNPLDRALRELAGWLHMENGAYDRALDAYRAIDRLEAEDGRVLFGFAQNAANAEAYDAALQAYREILERYPDAPTAASAMYGMARMYEQQGFAEGETAYDTRGNRVPAPHFDAALETYRTFLQEHPGDPRFPDALQRVGALQQEVFFDLGAAESTLNEVTARYTSSEAAARARFDLAQIALQRGDLQQARLLFSRLEKELEIGELAELAQYQTALIDYYVGQFASALSIVSALDANTSTDIANDAIALKVLLRENRGPDSLDVPLHRYARAQLLRRQRNPEGALQWLDSLLARHADHPLADEARYERGGALRDLGRYREAIATYREVAEFFPQSYLADRSLFAIADIYERDLGDRPEALDAFTDLLVAYPGSLLAPEVRARIRKLRGDGV